MGLSVQKKQGDLLEDRNKKCIKELTQGCGVGMQEKGQCRRHHSYKGDSEGDDDKEEDKWKGDDLNVNLQTTSSSSGIYSH